MRSRIAILLLLATAAFGANIRLYLKDGDFQATRDDYQVLSDRVRYYSTERGEWEEIPLELVDLDRTKKAASDRQATIEADAKAQAEEDTAIREEEKRVTQIPTAPGAYFINGDDLVALKAAEGKYVSDKKRTVLKVLSPVPLVPGKGTVEIDGESASFRVPDARPEFYFRLANEDRFEIIKLAPKKNARVVEEIRIQAVVNEIEEKQQKIPNFKKAEGDLLFKIWPEKSLEPGEYALIEFTEGKVELQVWDFRVGK
ncbi:MAG TPA: hypothetical protein VN841_28255 [Bryobacteraceae bacterium]|nr:hypothetical protein [Bryobacteraceae bacterium]